MSGFNHDLHCHSEYQVGSSTLGLNGTIAEAEWVRSHVLQGKNWAGILTSWNQTAPSNEVD